jgi:addiction module RelE/StbE family toxin
MKIVWSRIALAEILAIRHYIAKDKPLAAARVAARIRSSANRLAFAAESGRSGRIPGTRELVIPGLPYILLYQIADKTIQILSVLHGNQEWPEQL